MSSHLTFNAFIDSNYLNCEFHYRHLCPRFLVGELGRKSYICPDWAKTQTFVVVRTVVECLRVGGGVSLADCYGALDFED